MNATKVLLCLVIGWPVLLGWSCSIQACQDQQAEQGPPQAFRNDVREAGKILKTFHVEPTQSRLDRLCELVQKHSDQFPENGNRFTQLCQLVIGLGSQKYSLEIAGSGSVLDSARALAEGNTDDPFVEYILQEQPELDADRMTVWWFSFFATGDEKYLDQIAEQVGDAFSPDIEGGMERGKLIHEANGAMMLYCREQDAVREYLIRLMKRNRWPEKKRFFSQFVSFATADFDRGEESRRDSAIGTLRLFLLGMFSGDEELIRGTVSPISDADLELLKKGAVADTDAAQEIVDGIKFRRFEVGDTFNIGKTKMTVTESQVNEQAILVAFDSREAPESPPIQVQLTHGRWWVDASIIVAMRKSFQKARERRNR